MIATHCFRSLLFKHWRTRRRFDRRLLNRDVFAFLKNGAGQRSTNLLRPYAIFLALLALILLTGVLWPIHSFAQDPGPTEKLITSGSLAVPTFWYVLAAAIALLVPAGFVLIGVAGLEPQRAWDAALGGMGAVGLGRLRLLGDRFCPAIWRCWFGLYVARIKALGVGMEPVGQRLGGWLGCGRSERLVFVWRRCYWVGLCALSGPFALGYYRGRVAGDGAAWASADNSYLAAISADRWRALSAEWEFGCKVGVGWARWDGISAWGMAW